MCKGSIIFSAHLLCRIGIAKGVGAMGPMLFNWQNNRVGQYDDNITTKKRHVAQYANPSKCRVIMIRRGHSPPAYTIPNLFYLYSLAMSRKNAEIITPFAHFYPSGKACGSAPATDSPLTITATRDKITPLPRYATKTTLLYLRGAYPKNRSKRRLRLRCPL